jgi:hypothetical protein
MPVLCEFCFSQGCEWGFSVSEMWHSIVASVLPDTAKKVVPSHWWEGVTMRHTVTSQKTWVLNIHLILANIWNSDLQIGSRSSDFWTLWTWGSMPKSRSWHTVCNQVCKQTFVQPAGKTMNIGVWHLKGKDFLFTIGRRSAMERTRTPTQWVTGAPPRG